MSRLVLSFFLVSALLAFVPQARAVAFRIKSPDENTIAVGTEITDRNLRYDPKRKELTAILSTANARYAGNGMSASTEDLYFAFPGVAFEPATNILSLTPAGGGEPVPIGEWKKGSIGGHVVLLYETTVFVTIRDRNSLKLALDYDSERTAEGMKKKVEKEASQPVEEQMK